MRRPLLTIAVPFLAGIWVVGTCTADDVLRVWVKAFIPDKHPTLPDYIKPVPGQPGKFMVEAPFRDWAIVQSLGLSDSCFTTDNRGFSNDPNASARITTDFSVTLKGDAISMQPSTNRGLQFTDLTHKITCKTGKDNQAARAGSVGDCGVGEPASAGDQVTVTLGCRSKNPFFNVPLGPSIDYNGVFTYDRAKKTLSFKGDVGAFPAFEAYAKLNDMPGKLIFKREPADKATTWALYDLWLGINTRNVSEGPVQLP